MIVQRFRFHSHFRKSAESISKFVAELRQLYEYCEFGVVQHDRLMWRNNDQVQVHVQVELYCQLNDDIIQCRLLIEATLSFTKVMEIAQEIESVAQHAKDIKKAKGNVQSNVFM